MIMHIHNRRHALLLYSCGIILASRMFGENVEDWESNALSAADSVASPVLDTIPMLDASLLSNLFNHRQKLCMRC